MIDPEDLAFMLNNMWMLTYEEVQELHQALVTEWTFENPSPLVEKVLLQAAVHVEHRSLARRNLAEQRVTDGEKIVLRRGRSEVTGNGWGRWIRILESLEVRIAQMGDCP